MEIAFVEIYNEKEIQNEIKKMIIEIIEKNIPHKWLYSIEPIYNDYSGFVEKITKKEFWEFIKENIKKEKIHYFDYRESEFENLFSIIYINEWEATYESNYGKNWISYFCLLQKKYGEWKYQNFPIWIEKEEDIDLELDIKLDTIFEKFIKNINGIEFYINKIFQSIHK